MAVDDPLKQALSLHQSGNLAEAESLYRQILSVTPNHPWTNNLLGVLLSQSGQHEAAVSHFRKAINIEKLTPEFHNNLGLALQSMGHSHEAKTCFKQAIKLNPKFPEASNNLGTLLVEQGLVGDAINAFERAIRHKPNYAEAMFNLGNALFRQGHLEDAVVRFEQSIRLRPGYAKAYCGLGQVRQRMQLPVAAEDALRHALSIKPDLAEAHSILGSLLRETGRHKDAEAAFVSALKINPNLAEALNGLGELFQAYGKLDRAEAFLRQAIAIKPDYPDALNSLGILLLELGHQKEAEESLIRASKLAPGVTKILSNLGSLYVAAGDTKMAMDMFHSALAIDPDLPDTYSNLIFLSDFDEDANTFLQQQQRRHWYDRYAAPLRAAWHRHDNDRNPNRALRIGYLSADFRMHSAACAFVPMLCHFDQEHFEVYCYSNSVRSDQMTDKFRTSANGWRNIFSLSDEKVSEMIRADRIDILVDLSGHSSGNRLLVFARKPAPVQVTGWGHANGTGMEAMDYLISDTVSIPISERQHYTEEIIDLPCQISYSPLGDAPPVSLLPASRKGFLTFGCFNRLAKISAKNIDIWAEILKGLPDARLMIKAVELNDPAQEERVLAQFLKRGILSERLTLVGRTTWKEHVRSFDEVDIALDPFPHGGGISTFEALWMGCPVVALKGRMMVGRVAAAILTAVNMESWVADDQKSYVNLAVGKATAIDSLAEIRQRLRASLLGNPLGDPKAYVNMLEAQYRKIWQEWCRQS